MVLWSFVTRVQGAKDFLSTRKFYLVSTKFSSYLLYWIEGINWKHIRLENCHFFSYPCSVGLGLLHSLDQNPINDIIFLTQFS